MFTGNQEEYQYLNLITNILHYGDERIGRNNSKTKGIFGHMSRYALDYDDRVPLFTTKKVFLRGVIEELLWMLRGSTDVNELKEKDIHIWDGHSSRVHLDSVGLYDLDEGDIGPGYGFQWRHFGSEYVNSHTDYTGQGVDQIANLIDGIKNDTYGRRHIISAWNPPNIRKMALPPCHVMAQFFVDSSNGLSCMLTQRSADVCLGLPFNVASYSILTKIIAKCCGLQPRELVHSIGDCHIYEPHYENASIQTTRVPYDFPKLIINADINSIEDIENLKFEDFELIDYNCHPKLNFEFVV